MKIQVWTLLLPMLWLLVSVDSSVEPSCCGQNQIQVVGEATVFVPPDLAIVNIYFQLVSPTQAEGMKKLSTAMNKLVSLLKEKNYAGSTYETLYVVIVDEYDGKPENLRVVGKQVYQTISVFLPIIDDRGKKIGALADSIRKIQGLNVDFVTFDFKDKEKTELKAKQAAFKVAHQTAEDYCSIIDRKLGNILSIDDTYLEFQSPLEVSQSGQVIDETSPSNLETSIMLSYSNAQYGIKYFTKVTYELK